MLVCITIAGYCISITICRITVLDLQLSEAAITGIRFHSIQTHNSSISFCLKQDSLSLFRKPNQAFGKDF